MRVQITFPTHTAWGVGFASLKRVLAQREFYPAVAIVMTDDPALVLDPILILEITPAQLWSILPFVGWVGVTIEKVGT